ncbi:MAG: hypothetical protein Q9196_007192 [Gyalolechia fulgens]
MSLSPIQAVLGDFGKATKEQRSSYPRLGPPSTCAPEIDVQQERSYDNKIDIWSFGFAMARTLVEDQRLEDRVTQAWHNSVLQKLQQLAEQGDVEREAADLVGAMLAWDPARRPSASTALAYSCFSSGDLQRPASSAHEPGLPHKAVSSSYQLPRQPYRTHQQENHHQSSGRFDPRPQQFPGQTIEVHSKQSYQGFASRQVSGQVPHPHQQGLESAPHDQASSYQQIRPTVPEPRVTVQYPDNCIEGVVQGAIRFEKHECK